MGYGLVVRIVVVVLARIASAILFTALLVWMVFIPIDVFRLQLLPPPLFATSIGGEHVCRHSHLYFK